MKAQTVPALDIHDSSLQNTAVAVVVVHFVMPSVSVRLRPVRTSVAWWTNVLLVILVEVKALTVGEAATSGLVVASAEVRAIFQGSHKKAWKFMTEMWKHIFVKLTCTRPADIRPTLSLAAAWSTFPAGLSRKYPSPFDPDFVKLFCATRHRRDIYCPWDWLSQSAYREFSRSMEVPTVMVSCGSARNLLRWTVSERTWGKCHLTA